MRKNVFVGTLILAAATGCADTGAAGDPLAVTAAQQRDQAWRVDLKAEREALLAADRALSQATSTLGWENGFVPAIAADAHFLPAGENLVQGADAIRAFVHGAPSYGSASWQTFRADVSADGTSGYTLSLGDNVRKAGDHFHLRVIAYWQKRDDAWKLVAMVPIFTTAAPQPVKEGFGTPADNGVAGARPALHDAAQTLAEVMQADRDFAALAAVQTPRDAFVAFAAPTGVVIGGPSFGPEEIGAGFGSGTLEWGPITGRAAASGDLGYTIGYATSRGVRPDGTPAVGYSKYLTIWQRQPNGQWLFAADGGTFRPAPAN